MSEQYRVGIFLFDNMTMLDGFAPLQFLSFVEQFEVFTFASTSDVLTADCGAKLTPDYGFADCPPIDILVVPGGGDVLPPMTDEATQQFLKAAGANARYVTSVCSGAMILAEAGLLEGFKATTHWAYMDYLKRYPGIRVVDERVAVDRSRISGGGVTAGIDFALTLIAEVVGKETAQSLQLLFEYRPQPPFDCGSPATAPEPVLAAVANMARDVIGPLDSFMAERSPALAS